MLSFTPFLVMMGLVSQLASGPRPQAAVLPAVQTIKLARTQPLGTTVTVRGIISNGSELGPTRFIQDDEAGIGLFAMPTRVPGFDELQAGDSVQVSGQLKNYNGLLEIDPISKVQKISSNHVVRVIKVPVQEASSIYTEANEGRLFEITGVEKITDLNGNPVDKLAARANFWLNGDRSVILRTPNAGLGSAGINEAPVPKDEAFDVRGILTQYSPSGVGGYQLMPRQLSDLARGNGLPRITVEPVPVEVTPQSVTIEFKTVYAGNTLIKFGPSATELTQERSQEDLVTQHRITVDGLAPGTTYYMQVSSKNEAGSFSSAPVPVITTTKKDSRRR